MMVTAGQAGQAVERHGGILQPLLSIPSFFSVLGFKVCHVIVTRMRNVLHYWRK